jgi:NADH:ubiquinone oxidoreductase subunit K
MNAISNSTPNGYTITYVIPFHVWAIPAAEVIVALAVIIGIATLIVRRKRKNHKISN